VLEDRCVLSTFTVKPGGGGDFTTIQGAVNSPTVHNGDTILVDPGTYNEAVTVNRLYSE
jgi:pectin methylesterase-like acyl-CoA thioesterase